MYFRLHLWARGAFVYPWTNTMKTPPNSAPGLGGRPGPLLSTVSAAILLALVGVHLLTVPTVLMTLVGLTTVVTIPVVGPLLVLRVVRWSFTVRARIRTPAGRESGTTHDRRTFDTAD